MNIHENARRAGRFVTLGIIVAAGLFSIVGSIHEKDRPSWDIAGGITGLNGTLVLQLNPFNNTMTITHDGIGETSFEFTDGIGDGTNYEVIVLTQPVGQLCTVANGSGTARANVDTILVTCVSGPFTIGGSVAGLADPAQAGSAVILQNNGDDTLVLSSNGSFSFPVALPIGAGYVVTVLTPPSGQSCSIANGAGSVGGAKVTDVVVSCADDVAGPFRIGGTISGLDGTVVLQNNGGDDLNASADGQFSFATALPDGSDFLVTVLTQPDGQSCDVTNGSGTVAGAEVDDVSVGCMNVGAGGWQSYSDPVEVDINETVRVSGALVQMPGLAGMSALVAFRELASVHVNQIDGPPGPGQDRGRALETAQGEAVITLPSLAVAADGATVLVAWHQGPFGSNSDVLVKRATGGLFNWTQVGGALDADPDADAVEPVVRIAAADEPVVAWRENMLPHISHFDGTDWLTYGDSLRVRPDPVEQLRLALRPDSRPVLAWVEVLLNGDREAHVVEWDGLDWLALGNSVGGLVDSNLIISLAIGADDAPMVALAVQGGALIHVRRWDGLAWQDMGAPPESGVVAPAPRIWDVSLDAGHALTATGAAAPMIAWTEVETGTIVQRWNGNAWTSVGEVVFQVAFFPERVALAAHDEHPAVLVTDDVGGFIGRRLHSFRFVE